MAGPSAKQAILHSAACSLRDTEVSALLEMGATLVADRRQQDGTGWAVLADPEGNEFCVLRSAAERQATGG